jgi:hypothetical protein
LRDIDREMSSGVESRFGLSLKKKEKKIKQGHEEIE